MSTLPTYNPATTPLSPSDQIYLEQGPSADRGKRATVQMVMDKMADALGDLSGILPCRGFSTAGSGATALSAMAVQTGGGSDTVAVSGTLKISKLGHKAYAISATANFGAASTDTSSLGPCTWRFRPASTDTLALEFVSLLPTAYSNDVLCFAPFPVLGAATGIGVRKPASPTYGPTEFFIGNVATWQPSTPLGWFLASGVVLLP